MSIKHLLTLFALVFSISEAYAAGEPMNQDFTNLLKATTEAVEIGKQGKRDEFLTSVDGALEIVKDQKLNSDSPKLQKVGSKLKTAKKLCKQG
jgi:hypothetical protein